MKISFLKKVQESPLPAPGGERLPQGRAAAGAPSAGRFFTYLSSQS
jgi:hypothetical protein